MRLVDETRVRGNKLGQQLGILKKSVLKAVFRIRIRMDPH